MSEGPLDRILQITRIGLLQVAADRHGLHLPRTSTPVVSEVVSSG